MKSRDIGFNSNMTLSSAGYHSTGSGSFFFGILLLKDLVVGFPSVRALHKNNRMSKRIHALPVASCA